MRYMIAFDVGGTKTDAVLFDERGEVIRRVLLPGANPLDIGFDAACQRYYDAVHALQEGLDAPIAGAYGGVACQTYFGERLQDNLKARTGIRDVRIEADGMCLISSMLGHTDGTCLICGTGSALCYRFGKEMGHIGGWGYLVDSCGSGFILGKRVLLAMAREMDGRGETTLLTEYFRERCGESMVDHFEKIYRGGRPYIASFAELVFRARKAGDRVAAAIFDDCVADMNELIWTGYRRFGDFTVVTNGGIFSHFPEYVQALQAHAPKQVTFVVSDVPPVYGCAVETMYDQGLVCDATFRQRFKEGYLQKAPK